jgi:hypothetical protein
MNSFDPDSEYDKEELARLKAEPWQVDLLQLNPSYTSWGPGEDYMKGYHEKGGDGWDAAIKIETSKDFSFGLDELNETVNFYFSVVRASTECLDCGGSGFAPKARKVSDDFYDFDHNGTRWCDKITQDELNALHAEGRCMDGRTLEQVNDDNSLNGQRKRGFFGHDSINRHILIKRRCARLGFQLLCETCEGHGYVYIDPKAHVELTLWVLHPRKGCSRGVRVFDVRREDLPTLFNFLRRADDRNRARFAKVRKLAKNVATEKEA